MDHERKCDSAEKLIVFMRDVLKLTPAEASLVLAHVLGCMLADAMPNRRRGLLLKMNDYACVIAETINRTESAEKGRN